MLSHFIYFISNGLFAQFFRDFLVVCIVAQAIVKHFKRLFEICIFWIQFYRFFHVR